MRFNLHGQPSEATSEMEKQVKILNARIPVVQDLALEYRENSSDVLLNWSKPQFVEDFETAETWDSLSSDFVKSSGSFPSVEYLTSIVSG